MSSSLDITTIRDSISISVYQEGQENFQRWRPSIKRISFLLSALNLAYYLALCHHDLRPLQTALVSWGLSFWIAVNREFYRI